MSLGSPVDAYSMLYALPVALVATTFGLRGGTVAGMLAVGLTVLWAVAQSVHLTPTGWASRVLPLLVLGVLLGHATDRERRAHEGRRRLEAAALLHREAIEINDSLVQGMAAAKWSFESGQVDTGTRILDSTIADAHDLVSDLIRRADMGARTEPLHDYSKSFHDPVGTRDSLDGPAERTWPETAIPRQRTGASLVSRWRA
jgi:hypothetical protein